MVAQIQMLFTSLKTETDLRRNAEIKRLQAQINPHFLYNSLFFIMSMANSSPEAVIRMSKHLAEYYRYLTRLDSAASRLLRNWSWPIITWASWPSARPWTTTSSRRMN